MSFRLRTSFTTVKEEPIKDKYDVIVVGGGPAGLSAALYLARYGLDIIVVTKTMGGAISEAPLVDDYLGIPDIAGNDLVDKFVKHVKKYNVPIILDEVLNVYKKNSDNPLWYVKTRVKNREIAAYAVILAVGSEKRKLGVPGEDKLTGKGVSYCVTCDGPLFKEKTVAVIGGGNSALTGALFLSNIASKVYLIHRRDAFRAFNVYVEAVKNNPRIEILTNTIVKEIIGSEKVEAIRVLNTKTNQEHTIQLDGVFIEIGLRPPVEFFKKIGLNVDEEGRAVVNVDMSTNLPGVYVAGDAAGGPFKYKFEQIATAAAEGAIAADAVAKYIVSIKSKI